MPDEMPAEVSSRIPHEPALWIRNFLRHPNEPSRKYDFYDSTGDKFLWYLVDDDGPLQPENWGNINILLFARGCLKTFTVSSIAAWALDVFPSCEFVITAPVDDQREEVIDRFNTKVEQSGMAQRRERDSMRHMKFRNTAEDEDTGESYVAYSHMKSRSAWDGGDKLRGLHAHGGIIDESQDVDEGTFSTFLEAIDREVPKVDYFPTIFVIGTPKMSNTFFHRLWKMSDKKTWDRDEKEWITQDEAQEFLPEDMQQEKEDIEEKLERLRAQDGDEELIERFEDELDTLEGFTVRGWHIDQYNSPLHNDRDIAFKKETYSPKKFENEVKANFYSPEHDLITNDDVWDTAFDEERGFEVEPRFPDTPTFLAVDWGGGQGEGSASTEIGIAELDPDGQTLQILNYEILDSNLSFKEERDRIDTLMQQYHVDIGVVDEGYGDTNREELQDEYGYNEGSGQPIYGCWFGNVKDKEEIKWNRFNEEKRFFTTSKTFMAKNMSEDFKSGNIVIPKNDLSFDSKRSNGAQLVDELTAPYTERDETKSNRTKTVVKSDRHDDAFDVFVFLWIAANRVRSQRTVKQVGSHMRRGH